jgi:hypothetical protein
LTQNKLEQDKKAGILNQKKHKSSEEASILKNLLKEVDYLK